MTEEHGEMPDGNIGDRARTAVSWRALSQFSSQGIQIVTSIILARLLMPDDFGIIGMAGIITGLAVVFRDLGFGQALVQRPELREEHKRSAFWVTLIMAGLLYGGVYLVAPYAGKYFRDERIVPVVRIMALSFLMAPFGAVPRSLLQRELDFKRPFVAALAATIAYGGVGITSAVLGDGYWSLVWALLASSAVGTIAICIITGYVPPLIPSLRGARDLLSFGVGMTGVGLLSYVSTRIDYFIIGRQLDAAALGLYKRAYDLVEYPVSLTARLAYPVLFPSYSRLQHDRPRLRRAFSKALTAVSMFSFPMLAILGVCAPEFVTVVFGQQWSGAVRPLQILAPIGLFFSIGSPGSAAVKAVGKIHHEVGLQLSRTFLLTIGAWVGARHGVTGVAIGVLAAYGIQAVLHITVVSSCLGFGVGQYYTSIRQSAAAAVVSMLVMMLMRILLADQLGGRPTALLVSMVTVGVVAAVLTYGLLPGQHRQVVTEDLRPLLSKVLGALGRRV